MDEVAFLKTAESILSRDGLPAYMSQLLCPRLNKFSRHFSELFSDGEIQVRFGMEDGEVQTEIINPHGGAELQDQSSGEGRIAALITSFALREAAPKTNVLILDEPGDALDSENAKSFAAGIRLLNQDGIILMTHNVHLESALAGERQVVVEKLDGKSRVLEAQ